MALEAEHLITFAVAVRAGSLTAAGAVLHRSQPALSAQLRRLSDAAGTPLYRRTRYGIEPTEAGGRLLPYAQALLRARDGARRLMAEVAGGARGTLRVTASMTAAVYLLPPLLAGFREGRPELRVDLLTRNSTDAVALLELGEADVAFVEGPAGAVPEGLERHPLVRDEIVLVMPPGHPLVAPPRITLADLAGRGFVRREMGSGTRAVVDRAVAAAGAPPLRTVVEATGIEAVKEGVLSGLGLAFLSALAVRREVAAGLLVARPVDAAGFGREIALLHPPFDQCGAAARAFLTHLHAAAPQAEAPRPG